MTANCQPTAPTTATTTSALRAGHSQRRGCRCGDCGDRAGAEISARAMAPSQADRDPAPAPEIARDGIEHRRAEVLGRRRLAVVRFRSGPEPLAVAHQLAQC